MKKLLILLAATALTAGSAAAQNSPTSPAQTMQGRPQPPTPEQQADRLTKQLSLSADQRTQLVTMEQARRKEMEGLRGQMQNGGDRTAMRQNMQTMRTKYDTQLKGILTADQYTQYNQLREDRQENRGRRGNQGSRRMKMKAKS